ncbi:MAG: hypothetical protein LQ351_007126 [Letrouitia transgressa]|nr:MAG: hypothetical protein LQ351_007126 [Letrouitia transgressa]
MLSAPPFHSRLAIQGLRLPTVSFLASSSALGPSNLRHLYPRRLLISARHQSTFSPRLPSPSRRSFASDTARHPASTHPSASSPRASNPASVPPSSPTQHQPQSQPQPQPPSQQPLTWNAYLTLRRLRRRYSLFASLLTTTLTTTAGLTLLSSTASFERLSTLFGTTSGFDPIIAVAISTVAAAGIGWLAGPFVGEAVFRLVYRRQWAAMATKEKDFYARIKKWRVDPSYSSMSNPLPDYYGEKIGSVKDFRTWMRDQRAYNRKRRTVP